MAHLVEMDHEMKRYDASLVRGSLHLFWSNICTIQIYLLVLKPVPDLQDVLRDLDSWYVNDIREGLCILTVVAPEFCMFSIWHPFSGLTLLTGLACRAFSNILAWLVVRSLLVHDASLPLS